MKSPRAVTIGLTFIAGLYFILDFIVPPTLPGASIRGVVTRTTPATFSAQSGNSAPIAYRLVDVDTTPPQILVEQRDVLGLPKLVATPLRQVGLGSVVTIRMGPFEVKHGVPVPANAVRSDQSEVILLGPGQTWVNASTNAPVANLTEGMTLSVEQSNAKITAIDPGAVDLIVNGKRMTHHLGLRTVAMKLSRYGVGTEVQLDELKTGDTVQFGPATTFADNRDTAAQFNLVITTMAFGIGLLSLGMVHSKILIKRRPGWYLSAFFFAAVVLGAAAGLGKYHDPGTATRAFSDFVVLRIIASVTSTVFSLLAFYMASAAYRAFRIRNGEAALMMGSALIVMLGQTPFGSYLTSWMGERFSALWLPNVAAWILRVPNTAVFRGLIFGIMLGAMATALRYWLSMERSVTSGD